MNKINTINTTTSRILYLFLFLFSLFSVSLFVNHDTARAASIEFGTAVSQNDGTIRVDWRGNRGEWSQVTLYKQSDGTYTGSQSFTSYGKEGVINFKLRTTDNDSRVRISANSDSYTVDIDKSTGYPPESYSTIVTSQVYAAMQKYLSEGKGQDEAIRLAKEDIEKLGEGSGADFGGFREAEQGLGQQGRDGMPGGNTTTNGGGDCGVQGGTSVIKCGDGDPLQEMILYFTNFFFAGVGVVSIIGIIIGGVVYITAGGDASKTKQGITYITNAVIALVVFIFLFMLLNFMVPGGFFNNAGFEAEPPPSNIDNIDPEDHQTCNGSNCYSPY